MLHINNNTAVIKREILVRIAKLMLEGKLEEGVHAIPREMAPRSREPMGCCIFHDREILRMRVIARLGCSLENYDDEKKLAEYATEALNRQKPTWPMLTVLDEACNACVKTHYLVTNGCQACIARPCMMNCAKKAITIQNHRAVIDKEKCVNCGLCMNNCPYHAIIKIPVTNSTILRFNGNYGGNNISAIAGYEVADHRVEFTYAGANNFPNDKLNALSVGQLHGVGGASYRSFLMSMLGNVNYDYENRYYASASFRRDGSSRLGPDSRWANFWSVSAAWRLSNETFMENVSRLFADLKIKASFGTNGNLPAEYYAYKGLYAASGGYGTASAIYWSNPENAGLGWEKSRNFNVGFDWNLYHRIDVGVEYYNKYTSSLIFNMPASAVTGFSSYTSNVGHLLNDGIEVEISSKNINLRNFTWTTDFNFTWQRSIVKDLPNNGADIIYGDGGMYIHREGASMYSFYLPEWKGVNQENGMGEFWVDPDDHSQGVTNFYGEAGSTIVGKALPDFVGGLTNTMTFCDGLMDISFLISYQFGGSLFDYPGYFTHSDGFRAASMNAAADAADYWTPQNKDAVFPKPIMNNPYRWDRFSSRLIKSTDNIRMREITLGFNIPIEKYLDNVRVYFRTTNPFMIWSATPDIDPDVAINGYRTADVPMTRTFVFGVNLTL